MRQSLDILQANTLELQQVLQHALSTNPVLEIQTTEEQLNDELPPDAESDSETLDTLADDYREELIHRAAGHATDQETLDYLYESIVAPKSLQQHLAEQLNREVMPPALREATLSLLAHLNHRGFLEQTLDDIAITSPIPRDLLDKALIKLQHLDPPGVGAHNIRESLLIQLHQRQIGDSIEQQIVEHHLHPLALRRYAEIAKKLKTTTSRIERAARRISTLSPNPAASFDPTANPTIAADLLFHKDPASDWSVSLTNHSIPTLSISTSYKELMAETPDNQARTYIRDRIKEGKFLIKSISLRQETLLRIGEQLLLHQQAFLDHGFSRLTPMTMSELATTLKLHPATISRAVAGKYAATPHGLIELRRFFTTAIETTHGDALSNTSIKDTLQQIITTEPANKPYSDSKLVTLLKEKGIKVARRTIAKYRDQLGILPSHLRKRDHR